MRPVAGVGDGNEKSKSQNHNANDNNIVMADIGDNDGENDEEMDKATPMRK
uniref:Uncharacterized protein n=1 Tax=Panagrolaimus sp. ES5 TaxID=591445 RepID=A0AC34FJR1_9BILA